jgi:hypothetical protein
MGLLCQCPAGTALPSVPLSDCPESFGQIQKIIFQRVNNTALLKNKFVVASANPNIKATWTPLLAATDGTKVVQSPYIQEPVAEAGGALTYGGGNATLGGIPIVIGREATPFTGKLLRYQQSTIKALKQLSCEALGVYLVDEFGRIGMIADVPSAPVNLFPIPITAFFVSDKTLGGFEAPDSNVISWSFFPNWSDNLVMITPTDFNALTDLVTP